MASPPDREGAGIWEKAPETRSPWIVPVGPESRGGAEINAPPVMEKRQARLGGAGAARIGGATTGPWRTPQAAGLMEGMGCRRRGWGAALAGAAHWTRVGSVVHEGVVCFLWLVPSWKREQKLGPLWAIDRAWPQGAGGCRVTVSFLDCPWAGPGPCECRSQRAGFRAGYRRQGAGLLGRARVAGLSSVVLSALVTVCPFECSSPRVTSPWLRHPSAQDQAFRTVLLPKTGPWSGFEVP